MATLVGSIAALANVVQSLKKKKKKQNLIILSTRSWESCISHHVLPLAKPPPTRIFYSQPALSKLMRYLNIPAACLWHFHLTLGIWGPSSESSIFFPECLKRFLLCALHSSVWL